MGDISDYYSMHDQESEYEELTKENKIYNTIKKMEHDYMLGNLYWTKSNKEKILVSKLEDKHLKNLINYLEKYIKDPIGLKWIELLTIESNKRI